MLVHTVYFWLDPDLSGEDRILFLKDLRGLEEIASVNTLEAGTPAATEARPVVDHSYDFGLLVLFDDVPGHDFYSSHELHQEFLKRWKPAFRKVRVYDFDLE